VLGKKHAYLFDKSDLFTGKIIATAFYIWAIGWVFFLYVLSQRQYENERERGDITMFFFLFYYKNIM